MPARALTKSFFTTASALLATSLVLQPTNAQAPPAPRPPAVESKAPDSLAREVHHQLLVLPFYSVFDYLRFSIDGRKVTLSGQVIRQTLKEHAETSIKSIEGVGLVINNIEILPASTSDDELRRNVYRSIFEDTVLEKYAIQAVPPIHIVVKNGSVMLEGSVYSDEDKALAEKRTRTVVNMSGVRNDLIVRKKDGPADSPANW